jgi:very-short-patch-repair endonuclease
MTDAERALWFALRDRRFAGHKFRRQWTFGVYVADFCCIASRLIIEVDGGQHEVAKDARRTAELNRLGYRVVRFWNDEVLRNLEGVLEAINISLREGPHPDPLPQAGEGG